MCLSNYKSIRTLTNEERSMKFQILNEMINDVFDNKIDKLKLKLHNKEFV